MAELLFEERSSKGIVKDYYTSFNNKTQGYISPPYEYKTLMDMAEADPILSAALDLTVELATYNGYDFLGENKTMIEKARELFNDTLDFDKVIDNIMYQLLVYGDAYLEIRWNDDKTEVLELNPLETTEMKINYTEHGEIIGYVLCPQGKGKEDEVQFKTDEVIYFRHRWIGSQVYSRNPFKAMGRSFATKVYANDYLQKLFLNIPPKIAYFLKNSNEKQKKLFFENLIRAKTTPGMDLVALGEDFDAKILTPAFDTALMPILEYLRKEILMVTRVPPHWVGIMDGANRGIGENVVIPYETKIKKLQQKIASQLNKELMPKLKLSDTFFKWNAISLIDEKTVIGNMAQLKAIGLDSDSIIEYGLDHGLKISAQAEIIEAPPNLGTGQPQIQKDAAQSRQRSNPKDNMSNNMNKQGVSEAGKVKLDNKRMM